MFDGTHCIGTRSRGTPRPASAGAQRADRSGHLPRGAAAFRLGPRGLRAAGDACSDAEIAREEAALARAGGRFLVLGDPAYPAALAAAARRAAGAVGDRRSRRCWPVPPWRVVGARDASTAGRRFAAELAATLGAAGFVDGLGPGPRHRRGRPSGRPGTGTVAVLAGGIDQIYPPQNAALHAEIAARGLLLSELPLGHRRRSPAPFRAATASSAACRLGVVVIEAAARSGSLITAHRAAEQGREVFVVPGSPIDPRYAGSNSLIRDGAILVRDANDILSVFGRPQAASQVLEQTKAKRGRRDGRPGPLSPGLGTHCG